MTLNSKRDGLMSLRGLKNQEHAADEASHKQGLNLDVHLICSNVMNQIIKEKKNSLLRQLQEENSENKFQHF